MKKEKGKRKSGIIRWILVGLMLCFQGSAPAEEFRLDNYLTVHEIDEDLFVVVHRFPFSANSLLARMADGRFLLADTPMTEGATEHLLRWLEKRYGSADVVTVNCHFHIDNNGGNRVLRERCLDVYGSRKTLALFQALAPLRLKTMIASYDAPEDSVYRKGFEAVVLTPPNRIFPLMEGTVIEFGGEKAEIFYPGPAHTEDNVVVWLPARKVLFGGCMVKCEGSRSLGFLGDADVPSWPSSLENVLKTCPDAQIVVPGHGPWGGLELIHYTLSLLKKQ